MRRPPPISAPLATAETGVTPEGSPESHEPSLQHETRRVAVVSNRISLMGCVLPAQCPPARSSLQRAARSFEPVEAFGIRVERVEYLYCHPRGSVSCAAIARRLAIAARTVSTHNRRRHAGAVQVLSDASGSPTRHDSMMDRSFARGGDRFLRQAPMLSGGFLDARQALWSDIPGSPDRIEKLSCEQKSSREDGRPACGRSAAVPLPSHSTVHTPIPCPDLTQKRMDLLHLSYAYGTHSDSIICSATLNRPPRTQYPSQPA